MDKTDCQHWLHPINLWCRYAKAIKPFVGTTLRGKWVFRLYESYLWQPYLRKKLNNCNGKEGS